MFIRTSKEIITGMRELKKEVWIGCFIFTAIMIAVAQIPGLDFTSMYVGFWLTWLFAIFTMARGWWEKD